MTRAVLLALVLGLLPFSAAAQTVSGLVGPPVPADTVAPIEITGGTVGTQLTYRRGDAAPVRITRATNCTLDSNGACSGTWTNPLASAPVIATIPINPTASQAFICNSTATPTTTTFAVKCWTTRTTTLSLAIVTAGLNLAPATPAPAGTVVQIIALPPTQ